MARTGKDAPSPQQGRRDSQKARRDWVLAGLSRLGRHGIEGVRVEPLAKDLGVTKGSFYWHFKDRRDLHDAMLEEWAATATHAVIEQAQAGGEEAGSRLERLVEIASRGFDGRTELALRSWGEAEPRVAEVVESVDTARLAYLRRLLRDLGHSPLAAEARAFLIYSLLVGDHLIAEAHGRFGRKRVLAACFQLLGGRAEG
ncbi:MAG: TetR/AcrR family transcriptional regulator [Myxococcota bacterium]